MGEMIVGNNRMIKIEINNPDLEREIRQSFGENTQSLVMAFAEFLRQRQVREDIVISMTQLDEGEGISMDRAIAEIREKYE